MGMKQTASLIDQLKMEREMFTDELVAKRLAEKSGCLTTILIGVVLYALLCLLR